MSGAFKGIGKVFKKVAMAPIKLAKKVDKMARKVVKKVWQSKILRMVVIAVAAYFTAGAALAYFGAAGAAGGVAAASAAADAGVATAATSMATGAAVGAASAGVAAAGVTDLAAVTVTASVGAAASVSAAGAIAAASVGAVAGMATANAASDAAQGGMQNGNGTVTGAPGGMATTANAGGTGTGMFGPVGSVTDGATNLEGMTVTADATAAGDVTGAASGLASGMSAGALGAMMNASPAAGAQSGDDLNANNAPDTPEESQKNFLQRTADSVKDKVTNFFHAGPATAADGSTAAADSSGGMGSFGKVMLLKSAVDFASQYLQKPPEPLQYAGVNKQGEGFGQQLHTVNGGFGLATGPQGTGEQANSGIADALRPPAVGSAGSYAASLSNAALAGHPGGSTDGGAGNIGQTVANSAGVGGLIPQGAVNYMGNS